MSDIFPIFAGPQKDCYLLRTCFQQQLLVQSNYNTEIKDDIHPVNYTVTDFTKNFTQYSAGEKISVRLFAMKAC